MNTEVEIRRIILKCPKCERSLRVPLLGDKTLVVKCPSGCGTFKFDCKKYITKISKQRSARTRSTILVVTLLCVDFILPFVLWEISKSKIQDARQNYERKLAQLDADLSGERKRLKERYAAEVAAIDSGKLAEQATAHYTVLWRARKDYSPQYALSAREKTLLEMQALARDPSKDTFDIIRNVATKAAPKNSRVVVSQTRHGFGLSVDFDMSELARGEIGVRTKHDTLDSLKKEVVRLTSQVTHRVYEVCEALELKTISIGCRHFVGLTDEDGSKVSESNTVRGVCT